LRRFEAALLEALGFGLDYANDVDGQAIDPAARYRLDPEQGPRRLLSDRGRADRSDAATGSALLALAGTGDGTLGDDTPAVTLPAAVRRRPTTLPACAAPCVRCCCTISAAARCAHGT
jgi:hypothetical protein